jgi:PPOX class probable FMN-dependent enzyme
MPEASPAPGAASADPHRIRSEAELREVIAAPSAAIDVKIFDRVDAYAAAFIARAPLLLLATADAEGRLDVSPKGDAPGFVHVADPRTLLVPDRPGNRLAYGFRNLLERPEVGLIFVVPGVTETLRVNGEAEITRDPALLARLGARGRPALLVTRVRVRECFFHCGKAFLRSELWKPETWPKGVKANIGRQIASRTKGGDAFAEAIEHSLERDYRTNLY